MINGLVGGDPQAITVPSGFLWKLLHLHYERTTTATVGDRDLFVMIEFAMPTSSPAKAVVWPFAGVASKAYSLDTEPNVPATAPRVMGPSGGIYATTPMSPIWIPEAGTIVVGGAAVDGFDAYVIVATAEVWTVDAEPQRHVVTDKPVEVVVVK